jgi:hypothetical protein
MMIDEGVWRTIQPVQAVPGHPKGMGHPEPGDDANACIRIEKPTQRLGHPA